MRWLPLIFLYATAAVAVTRSPDIPFNAQMIDNGASETAAVVDVNRDGRLDIVSGENWYAAPAWTKHKFRDLNYTSNYFDNFSDLPVDVDGDGYPDLVRVTWFAKKISWWKNPARPGPLRPLATTPWIEADIHTGFNVEFAILADMNNDGKAQEVVAQENGTPQAWYEVRQGAWVSNVVSDKSYGHGIGAGDVNKDGRTDILTPRGWLEAPADPRAGNWTFHADWEALNVPPRRSRRAAGCRSRSDVPRLHARGRRQRRRPQRRHRRGGARLRRVLVRAGRQRQVDPADHRQRLVAGACLHARGPERRRAQGSGDRQALHGPQRRRPRRKGAARRLLVRIQASLRGGRPGSGSAT